VARTPKSLDYKTESTDFSFADDFIEDRRYYRWRRLQVKFPFIEDRSACGNIDFASEEQNRSFRGKVPHIPTDFSNLKTTRPETLADSKYKFRSDAPNASNVPEGYYGTSSGIFPIDFVPFSIGEPTNRPVTINYDYTPTTATSGEFFYVMQDNARDQIETKYYPMDSGSLGTMMEWKIDPKFDNPTEPNVRYPKGAFKKPYFK